MKQIILLLLSMYFGQIVFAQSEEVLIKEVLMDYIEGTANGETERITRAFHPELNLYSVDKNEELKVWKGVDYIDSFEEGKKNNRTGSILSIDYENNAAIAKVEINAYGRTYIDYFMLLKLKEGWKIIHKSYTQSKPKDVPNKITIDQAISKVNSIANDLVDQNKVAGFSFAIQKGNQTSTAGHLGFADLDNEKSISDTHIFPIASVTKLFVSAAILKLIEEGELMLDTTVDSFFPSYPNGENITIYHLLTHTSGIKAWLHSEMPLDTPEDFPNCSSPHKYLEQMNPGKDFEPGDYYNYSNSNFVLLAEIIEMISEKSLQTYLDEIIFDPLELTSLSDVSASKEQQKVTGYRYDTGALTKVQIGAVFGAGSLFSNAEDLLTFMSALKSGKIISIESFEKMTSYGLLSNGNKANTAPFFSPTQISANWKEYGYGMGVELVNFNNEIMYFHSGMTEGGQAFVAYFPHNETTFSMVINTQGRFTEELNEMLIAISKIE